MPYIEKAERIALGESGLDQLCDEISNWDDHPGAFTYCIYRLILAWVGDKIGYSKFSQACACVHDAEHEFRRRKLFPYEDTKIQENGDIY